MDTIAERVAKGAAFLDERNPGWWGQIDLGTLELRSPCRCVLGQLYDEDATAEGCDDGFEYAVSQIPELDGDGAEELGFDLEVLGQEGGALNAEWKRLITERRAAAAQPSPVRVADDLFETAFGRRPGGTERRTP